MRGYPARVGSAAVMLTVAGLWPAGCGGGSAEESDGAPVAGPTTTSTTTTTTTSVPECPASGARVALSGQDAAMGIRLTSLELTNCGEEPYSVTGYPELTLLDEERQPFTVEVLHGAEPITSDSGYCTPTGRFDPGPQPVTLAPGERAFAGVVWRNLTTDEFDKLITAPYLSVVPSEGEEPQETSPPGGIDLGTTGRLGVGAWRPDGPSSC